MDDSSRPELFFIYGLIVSVIVIVLFLSKIGQLAEMDDIVAGYFADELSIAMDVMASREGYARMPFTIPLLDEPRVSYTDQFEISYLSGDPEEGQMRQRHTESRPLIARVAQTEPLDFPSGYVVATDHEVSFASMVPCDSPSSDVREIGDPSVSDFITIIVSDPSVGCDLFEELTASRQDGVVQRVVVDHDLGSEVIVLAR